MAPTLRWYGASEWLIQPWFELYANDMDYLKLLVVGGYWL